MRCACIRILKCTVVECEERSAAWHRGQNPLFTANRPQYRDFLKNTYFLGIGFDRINIYGVGGAGWLFCTEGPR